MAAELHETEGARSRYQEAVRRWGMAEPADLDQLLREAKAAEHHLRTVMRRAYRERAAAYRAHRPTVAAPFWRGMAASALAVVFGLCGLTLVASALSGTEAHGWGIAALVVGLLAVGGVLALEARR